jgi:hypothetical protein
MSDRAKGSEKRVDPRVTAEHKVHLMVSLHGFDPADHRFEAKGITVNVSHHGALVRVNQPVAKGSRCLVHLPDGDERIGKTLLYGSVVWTREVEDTFEVAIEFDTRLQAISIEDSLDGV